MDHFLINQHTTIKYWNNILVAIIIIFLCKERMREQLHFTKCYCILFD